MEIESSSMKEEKSQSQDSWSPEEDFDQNQNIPKPNLFQKITIQYCDKTIEHNLDILCENPILISNVFPLEEEPNQETNFDQTQQQQTHQSKTNQKEKDKKQKLSDRKMESQQKIHQKNNRNNSTNDQAFFNAIEDDQNQNWVRKKLKSNSHHLETEKQQRALTCPQCFTQVCYSYQILNQIKQKLQPSENINLKASQKSYTSRFVNNIKIHEHKIIRNRFASQKMDPIFTNQIRGMQLNKDNKELQIYQNDLKARYEDINIKILVSCEQCDLQLGYWDTNQQTYVLINVI